MERAAATIVTCLTVVALLCPLVAIAVWRTPEPIAPAMAEALLRLVDAWLNLAGRITRQEAIFQQELYIVIDKNQNQLYLFCGPHLLRRFPVATGRDLCTPEGEFSVLVKLVYPAWTSRYTGAVVAGGSPHNPLGSRWLGLSVGNCPGYSYGIHGTNRPDSIGQYASAGCIRMLNSDVEWLYPLICIGTRVFIVPSLSKLVFPPYRRNLEASSGPP